jgi:hypothetical protein
MTSQGTPHGRFQRAIHARHVRNAEIAAREMGEPSLADALMLCELLADTDPARYERAALRWLQRFIDERLPLLAELALALTPPGQPALHTRAIAAAHLHHSSGDIARPNDLLAQALSRTSEDHERAVILLEQRLSPWTRI